MATLLPDEQIPPRRSRRDWLAATFRWSVLGLLGLVSGRLALRGGTCPTRLPCQRCGLLVKCELPRAAAARDQRSRSM